MRGCVRLLVALAASSLCVAAAELAPLEPAAEAAMMQPNAAAATSSTTASTTTTPTIIPHSSTMTTSAHAPDAHCDDFMAFCTPDTASASCVFTKSVVFRCGEQTPPLSTSPTQHYATANNHNDSTSSSRGSSSSDSSADDDNASVGDPLDAFKCRWNVAGDLALAPNVNVHVVGDACQLELSVGKMLLLQQDATLHASAISVDASFVRLEPRARVAAHVNASGLFPGSDTIGASSSGSGGQSVESANDALQDALLFFDARTLTADRNLSATQRAELLDAASASWDLAQLWATAADRSRDIVASDQATQLLLGSASRTPNASTTVAGGGRIRIAASMDVVLMTDAVITANGDDAIDGVAGGAGGSVLLQSAALSVAGRIEARGGNAFCRVDALAADGVAACAPAGGGGRIHIAYTSSQLDDSAVDAMGGALPAGKSRKSVEAALTPTQQQALAAAAGTFVCVVQAADGSHDTRLVVRNGVTTRDAALGGAVTSVIVPATTKHDDDDDAAALDAFVATDGAAIATHLLQLPHGDLQVANRSVLLQSLLTTPTVVVTAKDVLVTGGSRVLLATAALTLAARSITMDATAALQFAASVHVATRETLVLDANVTSTRVRAALLAIDRATQFLALESGDSTLLGGVIAVGGVGVAAGGSINVTGTLAATRRADASATFRPCNEQRAAAAVTLYAPTASNVANFTLALLARRSIAIGAVDGSAGVVRAAAALVCAGETVALTAASRISANALGARADDGAGAGSCVASVGGGGGYGGRGADSSAVSDVGDYAPGGLAYGTRAGVGHLGSGGGCVDGGAGGGVVMLGARGLVLDGEIHCNGANGVHGAGGGSGGFLGLLVADFLRGRGRISAVGGDSACAGAIVTMVSDTTNGGAPFVATASESSESSSSSFVAATFVTNASEPVAQTAAPMTTSHVVPRLCGGGGGGGRLQLTGCTGHSDFDACTRGFVGNYTVAGGVSTLQLAGDVVAVNDKAAAAAAAAAVAAGASGTFFGFPCAPGSGGLFCRLCRPGRYKSASNSDECKVCVNAPANAHYSGVGAITPDCDWTCDPGYSGDRCISPLAQLLDACGGELGFVLVLLGIAVVSILLGYACRNRKEPSYARAYTHNGAKGERQHLLSTTTNSMNTMSPRRRWATLLCRCFYWPRVKYEKLGTEDLPEHMARLYFSGTNDRLAPLRLRTTVPAALRPVLDDTEFAAFATRINAAVAWRARVGASWGDIVYRIVALLCYPFASEVLVYRRHLRVNALKRIVGTYNHACMNGPRAKALQDAIKVGYAPDYSLVYLELVNKESAASVCVPLTPVGRPSLPLVLLFAGCGSYYSPLYLDPSDLLVRSVPQCPELTAFIDEPWIMFVAELNALLRVVSRDDACLVETLLPVAKFLERKMAVPAGGTGLLGGLRIFLGRFYVQDDAEAGDEFKLGLLLTNGNDVGDRSTQTQVQMPHRHRLPTTAGSRYNNNKATKEPANYGGYSGSSSYMRGLDAFEPPNGAATTSAAGSTDALYYDAPMRSAAGAGGRGGVTRRGSMSTTPGNGNNNSKGPVSSIREEALRIRSSTSGSGDAGPTNARRTNDELHTLTSGNPQRNNNNNNNNNNNTNNNTAIRRRRRTFYEGWLGPVDASLPVPGVLISADELEDRLLDRSRRQRIESFVRLHVLPKNVRRSSWLNHAWMLNTALLTLLMLDLATTFALVVNLKCVTDGEVDHDCSASVMVPVLLLPPLTLVTAPIVGIVALALNSSTFSRRYSVWNALSMGSVAIALCACYVQSRRLVAPWFAGPLPLLPVIALLIKAAQSFVIERYVAYQETYKRRRGWRGLMKRRLSDASIPAESP